MNNKNQLSQEAYLNNFTHPRKKELAEMILDGKSVAEMNEAGYGRINILEAARDISSNIEGKEDFELDIPAEETDEATAAAENEKNWIAEHSYVPQCKSESASSTQNGQNDNDSVKRNEVDGGAHPTKTVGGNTQTARTGEEDGTGLNKSPSPEADNANKD